MLYLYAFKSKLGMGRADSQKWILGVDSFSWLLPRLVGMGAIAFGFQVCSYNLQLLCKQKGVFEAFDDGQSKAAEFHFVHIFQGEEKLSGQPAQEENQAINLIRNHGERRSSSSWSRLQSRLFELSNDRCQSRRTGVKNHERNQRPELAQSWEPR